MGNSKKQPAAQVWDATVEPIAKLITSKKGVNHRSAAEVEKAKVEYFRGKDFINYILKQETVVKRRLQVPLKLYLEGRTPENAEDAQVLGQQLLSKGFIVRAKDAPIGNKTKKFPDRLIRCSVDEDGAMTNKFESDGFYILVWESSKTLQYVLLTLMLIGILACCMWQAWPIWAKIYTWYLLVGFLTLYCCLEMLRFSSFSVGWIVGVEFWILPNLNDEYCGFWDSFKPVYSFERRRDSAWMLLTRFAVLGIVGIGIEQISRTHSISDVTDFVSGSYQDIIGWGEEKLMMLPGEARHVPSLEMLQKEELEEAQREAEEEERKKKEELAKQQEGGASVEAGTEEAEL